MTHHTENILFSIIIPTFNRAEMLRKAIGSVLNQTYANWELIIVDDGSTDNTEEVVHSFDHHKIYYYKLSGRKERSFARNFGFDQCTGDFICFLDSDDYLLNNYLTKFHEYINQRLVQEKIIACGNLGDDGQKQWPVPNYFYRVKDPVPVYWSNNAIFLHSFMMHRSIPHKIRFPEAHFMWEDKYFILEAMLQFPFENLDQYLCVFRDHSQRSVHERYGPAFKVNALDRIECLTDFDKQNRQKMLARLSRSDYFKGILQYYYWYASIAMKQPDPKFSLLLLSKMWRFRLGPLSLFYTASILFRMPYFILLSLILPRKKEEKRKG